MLPHLPSPYPWRQRPDPRNKLRPSWPVATATLALLISSTVFHPRFHLRSAHSAASTTCARRGSRRRRRDRGRARTAGGVGRRGSAMSFADLESGALRAPRKARGSDATRALVFQITTAVASYRRILNSLGTPKDTLTLRDHLQKTSQNILQLAKDAKDKLRSAAEEDKSIETSADKRIADMKLAKDFAATMEEFRKLQNLAIQREMAYKPVVPQNAQQNYTTDNRTGDSGEMPEQRALLAESKRQEVLQLDNEIVFNEAIIEEREQAIQEIQQQIGEVHEVFKDLATLVHAQGVIIEEIDTNIDNSAAATKEAKTEVAKASKTQKSNSSLLCLLLVIFGVVLLVVIIVLAA